MKTSRMLIAVAVLSLLGVVDASAECQIADAQLEEAVLKSPKLRAPDSYINAVAMIESQYGRGSIVFGPRAE